MKVLCAGGAEFFNALLGAAGQQANVAQKFDRCSVTRDLFICGSASDYTRRFVEESRTSGIPVFYLPHPTYPHNSPSPALHLAAVVASACKSHPRVIVSTPANIVSDLRLARQLSLQLVELAAVVLRIATIDRICVEGGATAAALIRKLEWDIFDVVEEIAPGVTTLAPRDAGLLLTVKPGSYPGWPPTEK